MRPGTIGRRAGAAAAVAATAAALLAGGCFSERPTAAGAEVQLQTAVGTCRAVLGPGGAAGVQSVVAIKDFKFVPDTLRIAAGTTVTWVDCEDASMVEPHTTTADGRAWSSPLLLPAATYTHRFDQRGAFPYHCEPHPFMKATVIVE